VAAHVDGERCFVLTRGRLHAVGILSTAWMSFFRDTHVRGGGGALPYTHGAGCEDEGRCVLEC